MADQLIVKPERVRHYAKDLRRYASELESNTSKILRGLSALGDTWRDAKYHEFNNEMKTLAKQVKRSKAVVEDYSKYLDAFAKRVEDALATKMPKG